MEQIALYYYLSILPLLFIVILLLRFMIIPLKNLFYKLAERIKLR